MGGIREYVPGPGISVPYTPDFTISGTVFEDSVGKPDVSVSFSSNSVYTTDSRGFYSATVPRNYTGASTPSFSGGTFTPTSRVYAQVINSYSNQNFVYNGTGGFGPQPEPALPIVSGTITDGDNANAPLAGVEVYFDPIGFYYTNSVGVYNVQVPFSGIDLIVSPTGISGGTLTPADYILNSITVDQTENNFVYNGTGGFGPQPLPEELTITGSAFNGHELTPIYELEIDLNGTTTTYTEEDGSYVLTVPYGFTGVVTAIDLFGTFDPPSYTFYGLTSNQTGKDFYFYVPEPEPDSCPVVDSDIAPYDLSSYLVSPARNAMDETQGLVWTIDNSGPNVVYYDVTTDTVAGYLSTSPGGDSGQAGIVYDPVTNKIVTQDYSDTIHIIDAATKVEVGTLAGPAEASFHMLALADNGTVFASSSRWSAPAVGARITGIDLNTNSIVSERDQPLSTDAICWASNIQRLIINSGGAGTPRFYTYDPVTGNFQASVATNSAAFNYEGYYIKETGHLVQGFGAAAVRVYDISAGTDATLVTSLTGAPTRASDMTEDTCNDRMFISDGNYAIYEYVMPGYLQVGQFEDYGVGLSPTGLAHSRKTNLVYYVNDSDITQRSVHAATTGTNVDEIVLRTVYDEVPAPGFTFDLPAVGQTSYDALIAADESNGLYGSGHTLTGRGRIINLGAPYLAYMHVDLNTYYDDVAADYPGGVSIQTIIGTDSNFVAYDTNGTRNDVFQLTGTVPTGITNVTFAMVTQAGGILGPAPTFTSYARNTATIQLGDTPFI